MENKVIYLVRSSVDNGYVFPEEDEFSDPSKASTACLAFVDTDQWPLLIRAVDKGNLIERELYPVKEDSNTLYVETDYGILFFRVKKESIKYVGKKLQKGIKLNWLDPVSIVELERLCHKHKFFFV